MLKILLLDIETAPKLAYVYNVWKENIHSNKLKHDYYMLSWSAKWLHDDVIYTESIHTTPQYIYNKENDVGILSTLWQLLDEADVVIAHNGNKFDLPSINTRFIKAGIGPPSPYRKIDTYREAKKHFKFTYNSLDYLGEFLGVGRKIKSGGWPMWERCLRGEVEAFEEMMEYNKQDVILLQNVYLALLPYMASHPSHVDGERPCCTKCGSGDIQLRGYVHTNISMFRKFVCKSCGGWSRMRINVRNKEEMKNTLVSV